MNLKDKLETLATNNPKRFWEIIKQLKNDHDDNANPIDFETWDEYFYNLYKSGNSVTNKNYQLDLDDNNNQANAISKILNKIITFQEVRKAIKKLKTGKSAWEDKILNGCLRVLESCLVLPITKLFNLILDSGKYPSPWCRNLLVTLYKGGGSDDPDNYRGISTGSCLAKLYSTVLYLRILEVNEKFQLINKKQIGFLKGFRTTDHLLVLDTIINEVVHKHRQKLFVAFVDLTKAYDKIDRQALIF